MDAEGLKLLAAGLAVGLGLLGPGLGLGLIGFGAMTALGSQRSNFNQHDSDRCPRRSHRYLCTNRGYHFGHSSIMFIEYSMHQLAGFLIIYLSRQLNAN
jgi:hypothetical protein